MYFIRHFRGHSIRSSKWSQCLWINSMRQRGVERGNGTFRPLVLEFLSRSQSTNKPFENLFDQILQFQCDQHI